jgi:hypothetical protein
MRLKASDPLFREMEPLVLLRAILANPTMHLLGYGEGIEPELNRQMSDEELAEAIAAVEAAQAELMILG